MNNDALVAALGMGAVAAVHGYRLGVLAEADARGLPLSSAPLSQVVRRPGGALVSDPDRHPAGVPLGPAPARPRRAHAVLVPLDRMVGMRRHAGDAPLLSPLRQRRRWIAIEDGLGAQDPPRTAPGPR